MERESKQEKELKYDVPSWLQDLLELAGMTGEAMFDTELAQKDQQLYAHAEDRRREFKALLRRLYFWYEPKFRMTEEVELDEDLGEKLEDPTDVWELDFDEARELFTTIRDLMEHVGHTQFETENHSDYGV